MAFTPEICTEFGLDLEKRSCNRPWPYSQAMLLDVSRTFALSIRVLPQRLHRSVLLAYLFCRMADTLEDDAELEAQKKQDLLENFRFLFRDPDHWHRPCLKFVDELPEKWKASSQMDHSLTLYPEWPLALFFDQADGVVATTSKWVDEMCKGMQKFTARRDEGSGRLQLETVAELDEYCYYVAGTVGYMLTDLFAEYSSLIRGERYEKLKSLSNSFGLALQITNIIKDIYEDFHRDTCYVPAELMRAEGIASVEFLEPHNREGALRVVRQLVAKALKHLEDALEYTLRLPRLEPRLRLFCLWPLFMSSGTLARVLEGDQVLGANKVKITRAEVKRIIRATTWRSLSNSALRKMFDQDHRKIKAFLERNS